jgi:hypothetical protein
MQQVLSENRQDIQKTESLINTAETRIALPITRRTSNMKNPKRLNIKELRRMRIDELRLGTLHDLLKELDKREGDPEDTRKPITSFKRRGSRQDDRRTRPLPDDKFKRKAGSPKDKKGPFKSFKRKASRQDSHRKRTVDYDKDDTPAFKRDSPRKKGSFHKNSKKSSQDSYKRKIARNDRDDAPVFDRNAPRKKKSFRKKSNSKRSKKGFR